MDDPVLKPFLTRQEQDGMGLARDSDVLDLMAVEGTPPQRYIARFRAKCLVRVNGEVREVDEFAVGIYFPDDYLRRADPAQVLRWLGPPNVFHPNVSDRAPFICVGHLSPGTDLVTCLYQVFEIGVMAKITMREDDALNPEACVWARQNQHRFPIDRRPLKRRRLRSGVSIEVVDGSKAQAKS